MCTRVRVAYVLRGLIAATLLFCRATGEAAESSTQAARTALQWQKGRACGADRACKAPPTPFALSATPRRPPGGCNCAGCRDGARGGECCCAPAAFALSATPRRPPGSCNCAGCRGGARGGECCCAPAAIPPAYVAPSANTHTHTHTHVRARTHTLLLQGCSFFFVGQSTIMPFMALSEHASSVSGRLVAWRSAGQQKSWRARSPRRHAWGSASRCAARAVCAFRALPAGGSQSGMTGLVVHAGALCVENPGQHRGSTTRPRPRQHRRSCL